MPYPSVNPATGEVRKTFPEHTDRQVMDALAAADRAFRTWSARPFNERSKTVGVLATGKRLQILVSKSL